jgi:hypothetical protein
MDEHPVIATLFGTTRRWGRSTRFWLGIVLLLGYLVATALAPSRLAIWLALGLYLAIRRWVVEEPAPGEFPDAFLGALSALPVAILALIIYTVGAVDSAVTLAAGRVWLPLGLVGIALCLDRYLRRSKPAETIGQVLGRADSAPASERNPEDS